MAASLKKRSLLERRLRELGRERDTLSDEIKSLNKSLKRRDGRPAIEPDDQDSKQVAAPRLPMRDMGSVASITKAHRSSQQGRSSAAPGDRRFSNYLASGSFGRAKPLRHEQRIQRNKALFMVIVVLVVAFMVYQLAM